MAQNEPRFGMPARRFKLAQFDRNHWHNKTGIGGTNRTVLSSCYHTAVILMKIILMS